MSQTADILLTTCNARYSHPSLGLRYLWANMGALRDRTAMVEFDLRQSVESMAEALAARRPRIVGMGLYIWNGDRMAELARQLRARCPGVVVVFGGPEISYETETHPAAAAADFILCGEGDLAFGALCRRLLDGAPPAERILRAERVEVDPLALPYDLYTEHDLATRLTYVETSRGCPFRCAYCQSSIEPGLRNWDLDRVLPPLGDLLARGARRFKFVDRTFNLEPSRCLEVLAYFRARWVPGVVLHFELVPGRLPEALRAAILDFPPGALRFEVGLQTFNEEVAARVHRRSFDAEAGDALRFLCRESGAIVHADLIAGLPGEDEESFAAGFDRLAAFGPAEIQLGILKRLRGTAITQHDDPWAMRYEQRPPYEVISTRTMPEPVMERIKRFARAWERVVNRGRFSRTAPLIWTGRPSVYRAFERISEGLYTRLGRLHEQPLDALAEALRGALTEDLGAAPDEVRAALREDFAPSGLTRLPLFLR